MGDIYLTTNSTNPSSIFLGTTWQKIEGRFLLGTSGSGASKQTGGSNTKTISQANLPAVKIQLDSFSLSRGTMNITGSISEGLLNTYAGDYTGAFIRSSSVGKIATGTYTTYRINFDASKSWTGTTNTAQPQTVNLGNGQALDITPAYYTVHMWLRLT